MNARKVWIFVAAFGLTSCANDPKPQSPQPAPVVPPLIRELPPIPKLSQEDLCKAQQVMGLIGKSRLEIPVPVVPALQRVACTTCPITMDYNPRRLNFFFDAETGVIKQIRCG
ncbi:MAG: peptidase inhibitor I78 [Alphaproteobacteria bacterium]